MFRGLSLKAVLLGVVADWALAFAMGLFAGFFMVIYGVITTKVPPNPHQVTELMQTNSACAIVCLVGGLMTLIPGFFTGWLAKFHRVKNALAMGVVSAVSSFVLLPFSHGYPVWYFPGCAITTIGFATVGGYLANLAFGTRSPDSPRPEQAIR